MRYTAVIFLILVTNLFASANKQIVVGEGVRLRLNPEISDKNVIGSVNTSEELRVIDSKKKSGVEWIQIETATRQKGWIVKNYAGARGSDQIAKFCQKILKRLIVENKLKFKLSEINRRITPKTHESEINKIRKEKGIPLNIMAYIMLANHDKRGIKLLLNSLDLPAAKRPKAYFALQALAHDQMFDNRKLVFKKWYRRNNQKIKIDDFALVRIFNSLKVKRKQLP
jgi:hypothetical protein